MECVVGVDFDNTIIGYDHLIRQFAVESGWVDASIPENKKLIRDTIRGLPEGERLWQRLQANIYGKLVYRAEFISGAGAFLNRCHAQKVRCSIVSHKTEFVTSDKGKVNLREAALGWMTTHKFFEPDGLGFSRDQVFFESTRKEKIARIRALGCTHFIDDLEEVFLEESFPAEIEKILYDPHRQHGQNGRMTVFHDWNDIEHHIFKN